jgi:hypothetical protein
MKETMKKKPEINGTRISRKRDGVCGKSMTEYFGYLYRFNSLEHLDVDEQEDRHAVYLVAVMVAIMLGRYKLGVDFNYGHILACFLLPLFSTLSFLLLV